MKLEIYNAILTKLLRKFPGEQRMCLTLIAIVAEARIVASSSNTMEINAILSSLDDLTMDSDSVSAFCTDKVLALLLSNLDNVVFKNSIDIANDFIDAINKRFGLEYSHLLRAGVAPDNMDDDTETEEEPEEDTDFTDGLEDNFITDADKAKLDDAGIKLSPDGSITISTPMTVTFTEENKAKEEAPVIKVTSNPIPQEHKQNNYNKNNFKNKNRR